MFKVPKGTRDSLPDQERLRQKLIQECENQFLLYDAVRMDTPTFEILSTLIDKYNNDENAKEIFILDNKKETGEKCGLRYDLTVPFSRYVKSNKVTKMRRYQIGKVFRRDNPSPGRYREFYQCDYDCLGDNVDYLTNAETLILLRSILDIFVQKYGLPDYLIKINSKEILQDMMLYCEISMDLFETVCSSIDKLDKTPWNIVAKELTGKGLSENSINKLKDILFVNDVDNKTDFISKDNMSKLDKMLKLTGDRNIELDFKIARGLNYYTNLIFEVKLVNNNTSIAGGGRYDNLCSIPCVGFSLGIDRILNYVSYKFDNPTKVWVISRKSVSDRDEDLLLYKFQIVDKLRQLGISTGTEMKIANSNKLISSILKKGIRYMIFIDDDSLDKGLLTLEVNKIKITASFEDIIRKISV